jgi:hypothetical protein
LVWTDCGRKFWALGSIRHILMLAQNHGACIAIVRVLDIREAKR